MSLSSPGHAAPQEHGSVRGVVSDADFGVALGGATVRIVETSQSTLTGDQGNYVLERVPAGEYTIVYFKEGYVQQVKANVVVLSDQLTDIDVALAGEYTEIDEFIVQELLQFGAGTEAALLNLRFESSALLDSISSDLMNRAGASDAASALRLVAGASTQDGKSAVIRGLPDRYVSSQMNGVRLPTADEDKRAVELDQFPATVLESIQVSKTFTPDQQGDASGGAVNVKLKSVPDEVLIQLKSQLGYNSQAGGRSDFLTYDGGGVNTWGRDDGDRDIQYDNIGSSWDGAVGTSEDDAPIDHKWSVAAGGKYDLSEDVKLGAYGSVFYERDSSYFDDGIDDSYWVDNPGEPMTPQTHQGQPDPSGDGDYKTSLFDVVQGKQSVQWGALGGIGLETENHSLGLVYLYTRVAEDSATLAEDTRGAAHFDPLNIYPDAAPFLRMETLEYTERTTETLQLSGTHKLPFEGSQVGALEFLRPEVDWILSASSAGLDQPDKRQFGSYWAQTNAFPNGVYQPLKPSANTNFGGLQRIWKQIEEESQQYSLNLKLPFKQWDDEEGYFKVGAFDDQVDRTFDQDTFLGNFAGTYAAGWNQSWSKVFPSQNQPIVDSQYDIDYDGELDISAWYGMVDMPLAAPLDVIVGARFESTEISIVNTPETFAEWFPAGATAPIQMLPGEADVTFEQDDVLPSIGLVYEPMDQITLRAAYSQTVARQTFKELSPILQQEYLGGPVFIGNPDLQMSSLENYDLRADYRPYEGALVSLSWFHKSIDDPIEYVQRFAGFTFTTAANYPSGELSGYELEVRQDLGHFKDALNGVSIGANATFIDSEVKLTQDEIDVFNQSTILAPMTSRDMTNAPEYLYNLYVTYDHESTATQLALFYTVQGDTLVAGAGHALGSNFVPSVYAEDYDTLNLSLTQGIGKYLKFQFQAKNLTNPEIEEVYRSKYIGDDVTKSSYTKGIDLSISLGAQFSF